MTNYLVYLLEVSLCVGVFWIFYLIFLRKLSFFTLRRVFLLLVVSISWLLPLSHFSLTHHEGNHPMHEMGDFVYALEKGVVEEVESISLALNKGMAARESLDSYSLSLGDGLSTLYVLGLLFFSIKFLLGLGDVGKIFFQTSWKKHNGYWVGKTPLPFTFSFGPFLFFSQGDEALPADAKQSMYWHEEAHIQQVHTLDILLLKIHQIVIWFNPLYGKIFHELKLLHECSADRAVTTRTDKQFYAQFLLDRSRHNPQKALIHAFAQIHLKERVQSIFSPSSSRWNFLWILPACLLGFSLSMGFSFVRQSEEIPYELQSLLQDLQQKIPPEFSPGFHFLQSIQADFLLQLDDYSIPHLSPIKNPIITSPYGERIHPHTGEKKFHRGVDFRAAIGTPVYATGDGMILAAPEGFGFQDQGWFVQVHHGQGLYSSYSNLQWNKEIDSLFRSARSVQAGDLIGYVGNSNPNSTGPHLHYEVGNSDSTFDPLRFLPEGRVKWAVKEQDKFSKPSDGHLLPIKNGKLYSGFGMRIHPVHKTKKMHWGVDFEAKLKTEVLASAAGKVILAEKSGNYGYRIDIDHGEGFKTLYAHLHPEGILVEVGESVAAGQCIALSGNSGLSKAPHLHYEILKQGKRVNPMDYFVEKPKFIGLKESKD